MRTLNLRRSDSSTARKHTYSSQHPQTRSIIKGMSSGQNFRFSTVGFASHLSTGKRGDRSWWPSGMQTWADVSGGDSTQSVCFLSLFCLLAGSSCCPSWPQDWEWGGRTHCREAKAMEGWDGRGRSSSTGAPCWGEASSRVTSCGVMQMGAQSCTAPVWSQLDPCPVQGHHGGGWPRAS